MRPLRLKVDQVRVLPHVSRVDAKDGIDLTYSTVRVDALVGQDANRHDRFMPRAPEPPSRRVEADLRKRIAAGEWESDEALPSVATLAEHYGVARATVAKVLKRLEADGLVRVVPAWGTFKT